MHHFERSAPAPLRNFVLRVTALFCLVAISGAPVAAPRPTTQPVSVPAPIVLAPRFAPIFTSNMVLQRNAPLPVFGFSAPRDFLVVTLAGQTRVAIADKDGKWTVRFDPLPAGGPIELSLTGHEAGLQKTITLSNVLVAEVW